MAPLWRERCSLETNGTLPNFKQPLCHRCKNRQPPAYSLDKWYNEIRDTLAWNLNLYFWHCEFQYCHTLTVSISRLRCYWSPPPKNSGEKLKYFLLLYYLKNMQKSNCTNVYLLMYISNYEDNYVSLVSNTQQASNKTGNIYGPNNTLTFIDSFLCLPNFPLRVEIYFWAFQ